MDPTTRISRLQIPLLPLLCLSNAVGDTVFHHRYDNDPGAADGVVATSILDASSNMLDGVPVGDPVYSAAVPNGANGLSLDLERSEAQSYTVPDAPGLDLVASGAITIEAWVRLETLGTTNAAQRQVLVFKKSGAIGDSATNYAFLVNSSGTYSLPGANPVGMPAASGQSMVFLVGDGTAFTAVHSTIEVSDNDWHYVAVRFDDDTDTVRFTLDDEHQTVTGVTRSPAANALDLLVGAHTNLNGATDSGFDGQIAELRISSAFLDDDELLFAAEGAPPFRITAFDIVPPNQMSITFESVIGHEYEIAAAADLGPFQPLGKVIASDTSTTYTREETLLDREFFVVEDLGPANLLNANFDETDGGFTNFKHSGETDWVRGTPASSGFSGTVNSDAGGTGACWGTNIGSPGFYAVGTDVSLRSPVIDLTGVAAASLTFAQARDIAGGDTAVVNVIDDTTDMVIAAGIHDSSVDSNTAASPWENVGPIPIPGTALGRPVRLEFRFTGSGGTSNDYLGWYIDDVRVTTP